MDTARPPLREPSQRGAALVVVLTVTALMFIVLAAVLATAGHEAIIAGLHRDQVVAGELAEGGLAEAVLRLTEGRPAREFAGSADPQRVRVTVSRRFVGTDAAYQEVDVSVGVGRTSRHLSLLVLQYSRAALPHALRAGSLVVQGASTVGGDVYVESFARYLGEGADAARGLTYAGWWVERTGQGPPVRCYAAEGCPQKTWYPATRLAVPQTSPLGAELVALTRRCPAGDGMALPGETITGVLAQDPCTPACRPVTVPVYGFDRDDPPGPTPALAVTDTLPCGLPYRYLAVEFPDPANPRVRHSRLAKVVVFEQWLGLYWEFDERALVLRKTATLARYPQFGAVPPAPDPATLTATSDRQVDGGLVTGGDFGCKWPEMAFEGDCPGQQSRPLLVVVRDSAHVAAHLRGHGTLVVAGDLAITGTVEYWGRVVTTGGLTVGAGATTVHGSLLVAGPMLVGGSFTLDPQGASLPVGRSVVLRRAWWER
jgi:hypothetical protein